LVLTRQKLPSLDRNKLASADGLRKGGYTLSEARNGKPDIIIIATGSEVFRSIYAQEKLLEYDVNARVVSMPSWELFDLQPNDYQEKVLPPEIRKRISVEAAATFGWEHYIGLDGISIGMTTFGASAPGDVALEKFGFTTENIVEKCLEINGKK
ncbi:MAG: transketolase C-terminal domain-containing protein, partial [Nitrososphaerales archaeon]